MDARLSRRLSLGLCLATLLAGAAFRLGPLDFFPVADENYILDNIESWYRTGSPRPGHFIHPPASHYWGMAFLDPYLRAVADEPPYRAFARRYYLDDFPDLYRPLRFSHWVLGVASVGLLFWLGLALTGSRPTAAAAALMLAASDWHAAHSSIAVSDVPVTLLFTASLGCVLLAVQRTDRRWVVAAAALGGLTMVTKYAGLLLIPPIVFGAWWTAPARLPAGRETAAAAILAAAAAAGLAGAVFVAGGFWEPLLLRFSPDGHVDPWTLGAFAKVMRKVLVAGSIGALAAGLLGRRLAEGGAAERSWFGPRAARALDRTLAWLAEPTLWWCGALYAAAFAVLHPYFFIQWKTFVGNFIHVVLHTQMEGHFGAEGAPVLWYAASFLRDERLLGLFGLGGLVYGAFRAGPVLRGAAVYLIFLYIYIGLWPAKASRYQLFLLPLMFLVAADAVRARFGGVPRAAAPLAAALAAALLLQVPRVFERARERSLPDGRPEAVRWIEANVPAGSRVLFKYSMRSRLRDVARERRVAALPAADYPGLLEAFRGKPVYRGVYFEPRVLERPIEDSADVAVFTERDVRGFFEGPAPARSRSLYARWKRVRDFYAGVWDGSAPGAAVLHRVDDPRYAESATRARVIAFSKP